MREGVPPHVAIIMDGNGRWAKERGLNRAEGHRAGVKALRRVVEAAQPMGIRYLTVYAFSTENWRRPTAEVNVLMDLLVEYLQSEVADLKAQGVHLATIGHIEDLPQRCQTQLAEALAETASGTGMVLTLALNYGGQRDIADACEKIAGLRASGAMPTDAITPETVAAHLSTSHLPPPDLIIRPSGEWRLSNFLLFELAYAELYFTDVFWPEFDGHQLEIAVDAYGRRERRFGGMREAGREVDRD